MISAETGEGRVATAAAAAAAADPLCIVTRSTARSVSSCQIPIIASLLLSARYAGQQLESVTWEMVHSPPAAQLLASLSKASEPLTLKALAWR
jgi:hypothetical protein